MPEVTRHEPGSFCWPELATTDNGAAKKFYTSLFGWSAEDSPAGPDMIYTMLKKKGTSIGGLMKIPKAWGAVPPNWLVYFAVTDPDATAKKTGELGGGAIVPPMDIPGAGRFAVLRDPQGAVFAVYRMPAA